MKELERIGRSEESCMNPASPLRQKPQTVNGHQGTKVSFWGLGKDVFSALQWFALCTCEELQGAHPCFGFKDSLQKQMHQNAVNPSEAAV